MTRVLVVEDELRLASILEEALSKAQYTVDVASDGEEALMFAQSAPYDAMVLDVLLPRVDGFEVCRRLRAAGSMTPILLLTARDAEEDKIVGLDSGADDYLTKPFTFGELLARLRALLRRNANQKSGVLRVSDLTLDPATRVVCWRAEPIDLTARDYRVLETLMRHPGWVVTREAMIESVWGFGCSESSNLIEVYIRRLRRKFEEHGAPPLIQTVRGAGYRLHETSA
jgi:two-component system OmpR family response regulator